MALNKKKISIEMKDTNKERSEFAKVSENSPSNDGGVPPSYEVVAGYDSSNTPL